MNVIAPFQIAKPIFPGWITRMIAKLLNGTPDGIQADQHQQNFLYGIHQLRVRIPGDTTLYRVIVAPADAPVTIGSNPADQHFAQPLAGPEDAA